MEWQPIETAPKDGTWFVAYRPKSTLGEWQRMPVVRWLDEADDFIWPDNIFDEFNPPDFDDLGDAGFFPCNYFESSGQFTHWMPLPEPPKGTTSRASRSARNASRTSQTLCGRAV